MTFNLLSEKLKLGELSRLLGNFGLTFDILPGATRGI